VDLLTALKVMLRHWAVVLIALLATAPIARSIGDAVNPVYEATGTLLLLSPAKTYSPDGKIVEVNPFTRSGNAERIAAGAVLTVTHTSRWKDRMTAAGGTGKYEYRLVSEVIMEVTITAPTPDQAIGTLAIAIRLLEDELAQRQQRAGAPRETWIYVDTLAVPDTATVLLGSRIRATAGVGILGVASAATLAFLAESIGIGGGRRRTRRRADAAARRSPKTAAKDQETPAEVEPDIDPVPEQSGLSTASPAAGRAIEVPRVDEFATAPPASPDPDPPALPDSDRALGAGRLQPWQRVVRRRQTKAETPESSPAIALSSPQAADHDAVTTADRA
jgi:hypothetical protein